MLDHGTTMASVIVANFLSKCLDNGESPAGMTPLSFIRSYESAITYSDVLRVTKSSQDKPNHSLPYREEYTAREQKITLINLSGGQTVPGDIELRGNWSSVIKNLCKQNSLSLDHNTLIVASFGNNGTHITEHNVIANGILPATMRIKKCGENNPIISVCGHTTRHFLKHG